MNELRISSKPTLGLLLSNPQTQESSHHSHQKIKFPKINTKLKKTHFTKYHSAFISAKSCDIYLKSEPDVLSHESQINKPRSLASKNSSPIIKKKIKAEINKKLWKLNIKKQESYSIRLPQKLNQSRILYKSDLLDLGSQSRRSNSNSLNQIQKSRVQNITLLTEIRDLNISPIRYSETYRERKPKVKKAEQINQDIQRSNKVISLIEKSYRQGFFHDRSQDNQKFNQLQQKLGLFAYLKRDFVTNKQKLTPQKVAQYYKKPSNKKLISNINLEARNFLKEKLHNDYRSHNQVDKLRQDLSYRAIQQQIKEKNEAFHKEYNKKYNVPYLSFLSLPKHLKVRVLQNLTEDRKGNRNK